MKDVFSFMLISDTKVAIFNEEDRRKFRKATEEEDPDSMGILPDQNLLFKATKVLKPYEGKNIQIFGLGSDVFVEGLIVIINVCRMLNIKLSMVYFNPKTEEFDIQQVM